MAFLSGGAMLPRYSLNFGLASISPTEKMTMPSTTTHARFVMPNRLRVTTTSTVPTTIDVVARILALSAANKKQVIMIIAALMLTMPSAMICVPASFMPSRPL